MNEKDSIAQSGASGLELVDSQALTVDEDIAAWQNIAPIGREFGSPVYERLEELDHLAFQAFGCWDKVCAWLGTPNPLVNGQTPENACLTDEGFELIKQFLTSNQPR